jgi:hypothetical protein
LGIIFCSSQNMAYSSRSAGFLRAARSVEIVEEVPQVGSSRQMALCERLDRHRYKPARFVCDQNRYAVVVSVELPNNWESEAFARPFEGQEA